MSYSYKVTEYTQWNL